MGEDEREGEMELLKIPVPSVSSHKGRGYLFRMIFVISNSGINLL